MGSITVTEAHSILHHHDELSKHFPDFGCNGIAIRRGASHQSLLPMIQYRYSRGIVMQQQAR